jgi:ABC-type branched-subunit amino acid transport system substrate-binding protein
MAAGLVIAACGSDDGGSDSTDPATEASEVVDSVETAASEVVDSVETADTEVADSVEDDAETASSEVDDAEETASTDAAGGEELAIEGQVEVAAGTTLDLDACPDDWDAYQGVDGDEIRIGESVPQTGQLASFGAIGEGMQMYFDYVNANDPIEGKDLVLIAKDDGYEAGRAVANVEEMLDTEDIFAFAHMIGTPINLAVRPLTNEACVPQLFNSTGFPFWGDPANWPWTVGNILAYTTETNFWCEDIVAELGEGATVAALIMNNDFGKTYQSSLQECAANGQIEIVGEELHDPAAPDVTNEMTTLVATDADVFIAGTTAAFCPQTVASVAASEWRPVYYMSYTCNNLASFFTPVQDLAGQLAEEGSGVRMTNSNKVCGDPAYADDPYIQEVESILEEYGGVTCADGSYSTGILYGTYVEDVMRAAAALPGGLNRVNLMAAMWNWDTTNDGLLGGTLKLDGVNDAYITEAAQIQEVVVVDGALSFNPLGDVIDLEGQGGAFEG